MDFAQELKRRVESHASEVLSWDDKRFPKAREAGPGNAYVTLANGQPKEEGQPIPKWDGDVLELLEAMVRAALTVKTGSTLVWRRPPEFEQRDGGPFTTMRLVWLP